jgi:ferredoxin--NADP+ reductase
MTRKIAIVGAGPSGCYLAQALLKLDKGLEIDILDRLPVPYGLVRYGVAPDHQGTKAVARQFARLFERQGVQFIGNLDISAAPGAGDLTLDALRELYDAVVLATGLPADRKLGLPGEDLEGIVGSGTLTRAWNDHPDAADTPLPDPGRRALIVGNGNVAMDVLRILSKTEAEFDGSDFAPDHAARLAAARIERIEVVGRSPAHLAKFDPVMVKEIGKSAGLAFELHDMHLSADAGEDPKLAALAHLAEIAPATPRCTIAFRFGWAPAGFDGAEGRLAAARFARADCSGSLEIACDMAVTAIGFDDDARLARRELLAEAADVDTGRLASGLYAAGWFRRGPRGTIPDNRADAQAVAAAITEDLALSGSDRPGRAALAARFDHLTDYAAWQRIDEHERASCAQGRVRAKLRRRQEMLDMALNATESTQ